MKKIYKKQGIKKETLFKDDTVDKENNLSLLTQPIFKPLDIDLDDTTDNDIDLYHEFLLHEFGLNHEDVGH